MGFCFFFRQGWPLYSKLGAHCLVLQQLPLSFVEGAVRQNDVDFHWSLRGQPVNPRQELVQGGKIPR